MSRIGIRWTAVASAAVAALPLLIALPGTARAADAAACDADGPTYAVNSAGSLLEYKMKTPLTGSGYTGPATIGSGWAGFGKVLAGPDGSFYAFKSDGTYYGHRNASGVWDVPPKKIASGFGWLASTPADRDQATVDRAGWLWVADQKGALRAYKYNTTTGIWDFGGTSRALDDGWDRYNLISAGDAGVLYGRAAADGKLYRSRFDIASQRWIERHVLVSGSDWNTFRNITSNGGDTIMATQVSTGDAFYYRHDENGHTWPVNRVQVGNGGWASFRDVTAAPDICRILKNHTPAVTPLPKEAYSRTSVVQAGGYLHFAYTDNIGRLVLGRTDPADFGGTAWTTVPENEAFTGEPSLAAHSDGRVSLAVHNTTGSVWQRFQTVAGGTNWGAWHNQAGAMVHHPVTARTPLGTLVEFAADATGKPWYRILTKDGVEFKGWMPLAGTGFTGPFATGTVRDGVRLVGRKADGTLATALFKEDGTLSAWSSLGEQSVTGTPAVVVNPGYTIRVFATDATTRNLTTTVQATEGAAFGAWSALPGLAVKGSPSAVISPTGSTELVVRGDDDHVHNTGEVTAGSGTWRDWQVASQFPGSEPETSATEPTAFGYSGPDGRSWAFAFRTSDNQTRIYNAGPSSSGLRGAATAPGFSAHDLPVAE
ncbi:tachylectin-related carbohydrate-binding protein [Streptomyces sp. HMX112]|uniref:tachylectin-related carbohydrate-binding protein n=1 Tax=Streptomyces sp. HMX112 TaxID=3390850 RepID=UPI003A80163C